MRHRLIFLLMLALLPASGAINGRMQWDVRTTGNDANGGGFDAGVASPGTNFSVQDAAQQAYTDLVIGGTTTQLTSAAHAFGSTHPGNVINITGGTGCTTGWYEIISVSGVTATMDRSVGTGASTCTGNLGGGFATIAQAITVTVNGNRIHIKSGTYTITTTLTIATGLNTGVRMAGYGTAHEDRGTPPLITSSTNSVAIITTGQNVFVHLDNIHLSSTAGTRGTCIKGSSAGFGLYLSRMQLDGCQIGIDWSGAAAGDALTIQDSEIKNSVSHGISISSATVHVNYSWTHGNGGNGINLGTGNHETGFSFYRSVSSGNTGDGIKNASNYSPVEIVESVLYGNSGMGFNDSTGNDINDPANPLNTTSQWCLRNSIIYGNTGVGVSLHGVGWPIMANENNAYGANSSPRSGLPAGTGDVTLTGNPFTNAASGDFSLNSTAGAGTACKGVGYPQTFLAGLSTTSTPDIGIAQQTTSGGGGASTSGHVFSWLGLAGVFGLGCVFIRRML